MVTGGVFDRLGEAGGTVQVAAGEYKSVKSTGISFEGRDIQILCQPGAVLDCGDATAGFVATNGEPSTAVWARLLWLCDDGATCGCAETGRVCGTRLHWAK